MVRTLGAPGWVASIALLLGIVVHPLARLDRWHQGRAVVAGLGLLLVISLVARARDGRLFDRLIAAGAVLALAALAIDALRGHAGTLTLAAGQGMSSYEEEGPGGRRLGLRPLGTIVRLDRITASGGGVLRIGGGARSPQILLAAGTSTAVAGLRLGDPRAVATGERALRLRVTAVPAAPLLAAGLVVVALGLALSLRAT